MSLWREHIVKRSSRSSGWSKVRSEFIDVFNCCAVCGKERGLEVHHIRDFSTDPELEMSWDNLLTLCRGHHLLFGHLNYWASINPSVVLDASLWNNKIRDRR